MTHRSAALVRLFEDSLLNYRIEVPNEYKKSRLRRRPDDCRRFRTGRWRCHSRPGASRAGPGARRRPARHQRRDLPRGPGRRLDADAGPGPGPGGASARRRPARHQRRDLSGHRQLGCRGQPRRGARPGAAGARRRPAGPQRSELSSQLPATVGEKDASELNCPPPTARRPLRNGPGDDHRRVRFFFCQKKCSRPALRRILFKTTIIGARRHEIILPAEIVGAAGVQSGLHQRHLPVRRHANPRPADTGARQRPEKHRRGRRQRRQAIRRPGPVRRATTQDAQKQALLAIKGMHYGKDGYITVSRGDGIALMNASKPENDGKDVSNFQDAKGKYMYREVIAIGNSAEGAGFTHYYWNRPNASEPVPKMSRVQHFAPWDWNLLTGVYMDDIDAAFRASLLSSGAVLLAVCIVLSAIVSIINRSLRHAIGGT